MQRKTIIVGNWKMHLNTSEASLLAHRLNERVKIHRNIEVVLAPSMLSLQPVSLQIDRRKFHLAAQNAFYIDEGAYTGEVSFAMLRELVHYAIIGHSERRQHFHEDLKTVAEKVAAAYRNGIIPILCVGETAHEKQAGETKRVIHDQLTTALHHLASDDIENIVIAYEPVWAISNGQDFGNHEVAEPAEVSKIVQFIRSNITELYGKSASEKVRVIYGGSSNADNAYAYLMAPGVDGLLPGGASLNYEQFADMIWAAERTQAAKAKNGQEHGSN